MPTRLCGPMPTMKRASHSVLSAATLAMLLLSAGCAGNPAKDAALKRATLAHQQGDLAGEAVALREACAADRKDADVCKRSADVERNALQSLRVAARSQCEFAARAHDNMPQCLGAISEARKITNLDREIETTAENAGRAQAEFCNGMMSNTPPKPNEALRLVRCAEVYQRQIGTATFTQWVQQTRQVASTAMLQLAREPGFAGNPGASAVLLSTASCFTPTGDLPQRSAAAQAVYADMMRPNLTLVGAGPIPIADICAASSAVLGGPTGRVTCASRSSLAPQLQYELTVDISAVSHRVSDQGMSKQYVARIDRFPNPEYQNAVNDEVYTREQLRQAEDRFRQDEASCNSAQSALSRAGSCTSCTERSEKDRACNAEDASEHNVDARKRDASNAADRLRKTPAMLEREIWATANWTVRTHEWSAPWRANLTNAAGGVSPWTGVAIFTDSENPAVPEAEIAFDPLNRPDNGWQNSAVREQVAQKLATVVGFAVIAEGQRQRSKCSGALEWEGGWLTCWAASNWWLGGQFDGAAFLQAAATSESDPRMRGLPVTTCQ